MKKTIKDIDVKGKRVLLRVDFNVPLDKNGNVADDTRIIKALPTIKYLLIHGAKLIVCSHLGRPEGKSVQSLSLVPVAKALFDLLPTTKIKFAFNCIGEYTEKMAKSLENGELLLLENLRFHIGEEKNDPIFAKNLASLAEIYVNDAFGTAHRNHASTTGVARLLPNAVGFLMGKEVNTILEFLENPEKPFVAVLGGAKVSDKIYIVMNLLKKADIILIGGGMSYTFLKALGVNVGDSMVEEGKIDIAKEILIEAKKRGVAIYLPLDHRCGKTFSSGVKPKVIRRQSIPDGFIGMDIGPRTIELYSKILKKANSIIWNGPMGVFEFEDFSDGTEKIAKAIANSRAKSIVGGGDSVASLKLLGLDSKIYHISTGGGASLKLFEGGLLPGVDIIEEKVSTGKI